MAARPGFKADYAGIGKMLRSTEMQAGIRQFVEQAKDRAVELAPVGDPATDPHAGRYKESFVVSSGVQRRATSRAYGDLTNTAPEAVDVEFGTSVQEAHHVLLRSLEALRE